MAISQNITPLSTPPSRSDPTNFDSRADTFLAELPTLATQINTWAGQANSTATTTNSDASAAATAKTNAETAQALAEAARTTATTQAGIATTQAGTATTQAGIATTQAGIATTQAGIATTQAGIATAAAQAAVNTVTGDMATLAPTASKIPLADANARVDGDWIGVLADKLTTAKDAFNELTAVQQYLIMGMEGLAGYWPADPAYLFEDSGGATPASINGVVGRWDSIGTPAIQATTAVKPYLRKTPTSGVHWLDSNTSTSALTATLGNLGAACTVAQAGAEGVTFTEGVTISSTYNIAPAFGFNGDVAIFDRALTASEKALLTRYMQRGVPVLGSNLVTDPGFDNAGAWSKSSGVTVTGGVATITNGVDDNSVTMSLSIPTAPGTMLYYQIDVTRHVSGYGMTYNPLVAVYFNAVGTFRAVYAHGALGNIGCYFVGAPNLDVDNLIVRPIL